MISHPHKHFPTSCINSSGENPPDSATAVEYTGDYSGVEEVFAWQRQSNSFLLCLLCRAGCPGQALTHISQSRAGGRLWKHCNIFFPAQIFPAMPFPEPPHTQLSAGTDTPNRRGGPGGLHLPPPAQADPREKPGALQNVFSISSSHRRAAGYRIRMGWICGREQDVQGHPHRAAPAPREQFSSSLGPSQIHLQHHSVALSAPHLPPAWDVKARHHRKSCQESWVTSTKKRIKFSNKVCYSSPPLIFNFKGDNRRWAVIFINTPCPWVLPAQHIPLVTEWYQLDHDSREGKKKKHKNPQSAPSHLYKI